MPKSKTPNERIKRDYLDFLQHTLGRHGASLEAVASALARFERYTKHRDFKSFHVEQAKGFKVHLMRATNERTGAPLAAATITSTLATLRNFFRWLADQPGYRSKSSRSDAEYFTPPTALARIASAKREKSYPTVDQVRAVLANMPATTDIEMRNRALVAFTLLTGARDGAIVGVRLRHVDIVARRFDQDARDLATKGAKTFSTTFFPVGEDVFEILADWLIFLRTERHWRDADPLFPATEMGIGADGRFAATGLARRPWTTATPVRAVFRSAFESAGQPYANPHSLRYTLVRLGYAMELSPEEFKAWSQNLGHADVLTTLTSYGELPAHRKSEIMRGLAERRKQTPHLEN